MKINEYQQKETLEDRIDYYYRMKTKEVNEILDFLRKYSQKFIGKVSDREIIFSLNDVYYFESVDKKTFAYLDNEVVRIDIRLQDLETAYFEMGFVRVSKSTIINVYKIKSLKSEINMRIVALLDNGERIQINRSYKANFNSFLNTMNMGGFQNETDK